jgi:ATP-dependent RNA circularization protein (DNA/RNA ligase family)
MKDFFRFPHTPHLAWLGREGIPRDDKVLSPGEAKALLAGNVVVEEKIDGANLGFSLDVEGNLRIQNRGQYLVEPHAGQFARLPAWLRQHGDAISRALAPERILFGEWCAARHSLDYSALPDWLLLFDVYDRAARRFWSTTRRDALASAAGLFTVPMLMQGRVSLSTLKQQVLQMPSRYRAGQALEGVIVRRQSADWCGVRAKLVRPDFAQSMDTHWRRRAIEWNVVAHGWQGRNSK